MASQFVLEITDQTFQTLVLESDKPVLVDFWASWCPPCVALGPTIDALATEFAGKVKVGKVDADQNRDVLMKYDVQALPTIILFSKGQIVQKFVGLRSKKELTAELQKVS